jgi:hypothetical protein
MECSDMKILFQFQPVICVFYSQLCTYAVSKTSCYSASSVIAIRVSTSRPFSATWLSCSDSFWFLCTVSSHEIVLWFLQICSSVSIEEGWCRNMFASLVFKIDELVFLCLYVLQVSVLDVCTGHPILNACAPCKYKFREVHATSILFIFHATSLPLLSPEWSEMMFWFWIELV